MPDTTTAQTPTQDPTAPPAGTAPPAAPVTPPDTSPPAVTAGDEALGDGGKKALEQERKARRDAEAAARRLETELAEFRTSQLSEQEKAIETARAAGKAEALGETGLKLVQAEAKAAAAGKLSNPALISRLLDLEQFVPADGADIDQLITDEPYLAVTPAATPPTGTPPPAGTVAGGAQGGSVPGFKRSQLRDPAFYQANREAILKASREGRISDD